MADSNEDWIKRRAYELWEEEGYPSGKDFEHWERAKLEFVTLKPVAEDKPARKKASKSAAAAKPAKTKTAKAPAKKPVTSATKPAAVAAKAEAPARKKSSKLATAS